MKTKYEILKSGVIHQVTQKSIKYNKKYIQATYNTYGIATKHISYLRLGYIVGSINKIPDSILDVGFGNGDFLKICEKKIKNCYGNDISGYPLPKNIKFVSEIEKKFFDVITFFDSLEHFQNIHFVKNLKCNYVVISVPYCHYFSEEWFENWKHRRENEHLWHFNEKSLINFMKECGFTVLNYCNIEDTIRKSTDNNQNILTAIFKKK